MNLTTIINLNSEQQRQIALVSAAMIALLTLAYIGTDLYQSLLINQDHATTSTQPAKQKIATEFTDNSHLLFGQNPSTTSHTPLPSTKLQLILRGAFTANDPSNATAIIENADQTRSYRVGSLITGNTKLHAVHSERVVLSNNGKLETLYFPIADPVTGLTQDQVVIPQQNQTASQQGSVLSEQQRKTMIKKRLQELRAKVKAQGL